MRPTRERKRARGECDRCPAPARDGKTTCEACGEKTRTSAREYYAKNRDVVLAKANGPEGKAYRRAQVVKRYGLTLDQYERMLEDQGGRCAICKHPETATHWQNGVVRSLAVDHCHRTGQVRSLLCHRCNRVVGLLNEDVELLKGMQEYLEDSMMAVGRKVLQDMGLAAGGGE